MWLFYIVLISSSKLNINTGTKYIVPACIVIEINTIQSSYQYLEKRSSSHEAKRNQHRHTTRRKAKWKFDDLESWMKKLKIYIVQPESYEKEDKLNSKDFIIEKTPTNNTNAVK